MPTYEVRRVKPSLVSVTVEAANELAAIRDAERIFSRDAFDVDAYQVTRQPFGADDTGDARSEARGEWNEGDVADDAAEAFRWGYGGEPTRLEGADE